MWKKLCDLRPGEMFVDGSGRLAQKTCETLTDGSCIFATFVDGAWGDPRTCTGYHVVQVIKPVEFMSESNPHATFVLVEHDGEASIEEAMEV